MRVAPQPVFQVCGARGAGVANCGLFTQCASNFDCCIAWCCRL